MPIPCHMPPDRAAVIQVIHVSAMRGDGSAQNPERMIQLYFSLEGDLLACFDPLNGAPDAYRAAPVAAGQGGGGKTAHEAHTFISSNEAA